MNKKTIVLAVIVAAITSSTAFGDWRDYTSDYVSDADYRYSRNSSKFNAYSKKCLKRPESKVLYHRTLKRHHLEQYTETCRDIREKYDIGHIRKAIMRVAEIIKKYAYHTTQYNRLSDYVFNEASLASGIGGAPFEREYLPLLNVISNSRDVYKLNRGNPDFHWCDAFAKKYGTKNYFPAVRIVLSHVVAQKLVGKDEFRNLESLGDIVFKGLEKIGIIVSERDTKMFLELERHSMHASIAPKGSSSSWLNYAIIGAPIAAVAAALLFFNNKSKEA